MSWTVSAAKIPASIATKLTLAAVSEGGKGGKPVKDFRHGTPRGPKNWFTAIRK